MNKNTLVLGIIVLVIVVALVSYFTSNSSTPVAATTGTSNPSSVTTATTPIATTSPTVSSSTVPLMQSTGVLFTQFKNYSKAHEIFPTLASDTTKALGAFSYKEENLGSGVYRFTLTNNAEGYKGQSVTVTTGQSVYFIEPANGDDSASEDSITTDDSLVAVDAQGYMLQ